MKIPLGLYEFVAYVVPGAVLLGFLALLPTPYASLLAPPQSATDLTLLLGIAFVMGHVLQSLIGQAISEVNRFSYSREGLMSFRPGYVHTWLCQFRSAGTELVATTPQPRPWPHALPPPVVQPYAGDLIRRITNRLHVRFGNVSALTPSRRFDLCFAALDDTGNWEVYSGLSKLYEGLAAAFFIGALFFLVGGVLRGELVVRETYAVPRLHAAGFAAASVLLAIVFLDRRRFFQFMAANAIYTLFLASMP